jgi:hypothetical protein
VVTTEHLDKTDKLILEAEEVEVIMMHLIPHLFQGQVEQELLL